MGYFSQYLTRVIVYIPRIGNSDRGDATFGAPETVACCVEWKTREALDAAGQKRIASGTVITDRELITGSRIEYQGHRAILLDCKPVYDLDGNLDHWEAVF